MKKIYPAIGKSMLSFIQPKDFLLIDTNELMDFEFGDIIVYKNSASILLAHRFIVKNSDYVLVAGDNCRRFEKISVSQIVGKVLLIIKGKDIYPIHKKICGKKYVQYSCCYLYL